MAGRLSADAATVHSRAPLYILMARGNLYRSRTELRETSAPVLRAHSTRMFLCTRQMLSGAREQSDGS